MKFLGNPLVESVNFDNMFFTFRFPFVVGDFLSEQQEQAFLKIFPLWATSMNINGLFHVSKTLR